MAAARAGTGGLELRVSLASSGGEANLSLNHALGGANMMAKQKKLERWMSQLEALLNDGTREYRALDNLLNRATIELAAIKRTKKRRSK